MASKAGQPEKAENPEELLELAEQTLDRLRVMYEQYFLGMQKQAPGVLHSEVERRARDLQQANLRNTALRYRFATLQQKLGSYNAYWKRTLRQIENGTYFRNLAKIGRNAATTGKEIPEEILAAMPKRMREQVVRDRAAAVAQQARRGSKKGKDVGPVPTDAELLDLDHLAAQADEAIDVLGAAHYEAPMELPPEDLADVVAMINEPSELRRQMKNIRGPHKIAEDDGELDIDKFFAAVEAEGPAAAQPARAQDRGVNFRSVTRSSAEIPLPQPPENLMQQTSPARPPVRPSQQMTVQSPPRPSQQMAAQPPPGSQAPPRPSQQMAAQVPGAPPRPSQQMAAQPPPGSQAPPRPSQQMAAQVPGAPQRPSQPMPTQPPQRQSQPMAAQPPTQPPPIPGPPRRAPTVPPPIPPPAMRSAPSQSVRPNPIAPGAAANARLPVPVPAQAPIPRAATPLPVAPAQAPARPSRPPQRAHSDTDPEPPRAAPPPPARTMPEADFNALHAQYVKAKQMIGEEAGPGTRAKLEKTIATQTSKIREQYGAKSVDFQVVVKDNQVIIRAKPKP